MHSKMANLDPIPIQTKHERIKLIYKSEQEKSAKVKVEHYGPGQLDLHWTGPNLFSGMLHELLHMSYSNHHQTIREECGN